MIAVGLSNLLKALMRDIAMISWRYLEARRHILHRVKRTLDMSTVLKAFGVWKI
jgi:hypothetical protein